MLKQIEKRLTKGYESEQYLARFADESLMYKKTDKQWRIIQKGRL